MSSCRPPILLSVLLFLTPLSSPAADPIHGNVVLTLEGGLSRGGDRRSDVEFEFAVRKGQWPRKGLGYAMWFCRGHHEATLAASEVQGNTLKLTLEAQVVGDHWVEGGEARYEVVLQRDGLKFTGTYSGCFTQNGFKRMNFPLDRKPGNVQRKEGIPPIALEGKVVGAVQAPWPELVPTHVPFERGEHPRLIFRKSDVPSLRKYGEETPEGQAILERSKAVLGKRGPRQGDKFTTWPAVGFGFMYQMTGDKEHADTARKIVDATIFENRAGRRGQGISQDIHHAPRLQGLALAFDLCFDAWDRDYRLKCISEIEQRTRELMDGTFEGRRMSGLNLGWWSNHNAIRVGSAALGAMAVHGERNSKGQTIDFSKPLEVCARELRGHYRHGLGKSGYCMEGAFYKVMTMQRGSVHGVHAFETALGQKILADLGDFDLVGYFMEADPGRTPKIVSVVWAVGFGTVPADMMPGIKWLHSRTVGLEGSKTFGIDHGLLAPYAMATYPFQVTAKPPAESLRWIAPDENKGHFIVRPAYKDNQDILLVMNLKSETLRASWAAARAGPHMHLNVQGFGRKWIDGQYLVKTSAVAAINEHHGATVTSYRQGNDRTAIINMNLDRAYLAEVKAKGSVNAAAYGGKAVVRFPYWSNPMIDFGIRGTRSMAIDCSTKSGAPLLVASVDRIVVPGGKWKTKTTAKPDTPGRTPSAAPPTVWGLPVAAGPVKTEGNCFTVGAPAGPTLSGVLVTPGLKENSVSATGEGTYFVVFTLQNGPAPKFRVEGEGLASVVRIGERTVRYRDGTLTLE